MTAALVGLLLPVIAVWIWLFALQLRRGDESFAVTAAIAFGGGVGLSSCSTIWFVTHGLVIGRAFVIADALLWIALAVSGVWWLRRSRHTRSWSPKNATGASNALTWIDWAVRAVFVIVAALAIATAVMEYLASPHGQWDAWAIWNQKARFLFRGGSQWVGVLLVDWSNPGHPMLVSTTVARLWAYAGRESTTIPALVATLFGVAIAAAVMGALDLRRRRAWIAGSVLLAPALFVQQAISQQADVPLAFFIVSTLIVLRREPLTTWLDAPQARASLFLAGFLGSLAAWTKNEGLVFVVVVALLVTWTVLRHGRVRDVLWWAAGAAPALLTVAWFKLVIAPVRPPYLSQDQTLPMALAQLFEPARHAVVATTIGQRMLAWGEPAAMGAIPLTAAAAAMVSVTKAGRSARTILAAAILMLGAYYVVYLLTPLEVVKLITMSSDRVLTQLWPSLVLAAFSTGERRL